MDAGADAALDPVLATVQDPWAYIAIFALGVVGYGLRMLLRALMGGTLRTDREVAALEKRAETAEAAMRVRDEQVDGALRVLPQIAEVLEKFHQAGEEIRQEREASRGEGDREGTGEGP